MPRQVLAPLPLNQSGGAAGGGYIPLHFRCPISLDLMRDPVILCTGQTYDRSSIEKWISSGNATCPVTMQKLHDLTLIPNHTLRRLIHDWCSAHRRRLSSDTSPLLDCSKIRALMAKSLTGDLSALQSIRILAKEGGRRRRNAALLADFGVVPALISVVFGSSAEASAAMAPPPPSAAAIEEALAALALFPLSDADRISITQPPHRLRFLCHLLNNAGSMATRANAAALIAALSDSKELQELRVVLAMAPGLMEGLVEMVEQESKAAMKALFSLCLRSQGKEAAVSAGAAMAMAKKLAIATAAMAMAKKGAAMAMAKASETEQWRRDIERAVGTIELLCRSEAGCCELAGENCRSLVVPSLLRLILTVSDRATEFSVGSLLAISGRNPEAAACAVRSGAIKELLLLIQSNCTQRAKSKAMSLLKLLSDGLGFGFGFGLEPKAESSLYDIDVEHHHSCFRRHGHLEYGRTDVVPF